MSVEYWLGQLRKKLGEPESCIQIKLITDSQASIQIREGLQNRFSMKNLLQPDIDVAMEIDRCQTENTHSHVEFHKVKSHIEEADAPNDFFWRINEEADTLATAARVEALAGTLQAHKPPFLTGARAMCTIQGQICTAKLHKRVYNSVYESLTEEYLCHRYNWLEKVFKYIDWEAHQTVLLSYHGTKKTTVIKYIHGWLATKKR